jgi:hypothetical protein
MVTKRSSTKWETSPQAPVKIGTEENSLVTLMIPKSDAVKSIPICIILSLVTCGLYLIYWNYCEMKTLNGLLGREEYSFWTWLLLTIVTCGLFHIYYEYRLGVGVVELQGKYGVAQDGNFASICLILSIIGLSIVADALQQHEINKIYERNVTPA